MFHTTRELDPPEDPKDKVEGNDKKIGKKEDEKENASDKCSEKGSEKAESENGEQKDDDKNEKKDEKKEKEKEDNNNNNTKGKEKDDSDASSLSSGLSSDGTQKGGNTAKVVPMNSQGLISFSAKGDFPMEMTRHQFMNVRSIQMNPIGDRIALCFGFKHDDPKSVISFEDYMQRAADFNRPGNRDIKLKLAFKIQDYDNDEKIDKTDLKTYYDAIARNGNMAVAVPKKVRNEVVSKVLSETSSDPKKKFLNFEDFQRVIGTTDFDTNLKVRWW